MITHPFRSGLGQPSERRRPCKQHDSHYKRRNDDEEHNRQRGRVERLRRPHEFITRIANRLQPCPSALAFRTASRVNQLAVRTASRQVGTWV